MAARPAPLAPPAATSRPRRGSLSAGNSPVTRLEGFLPKQNPLVGSLLHAPSSFTASSHYFRANVQTSAERRKANAWRNNPFTGTFHVAPGVWRSSAYALKKKNVKQLLRTTPAEAAQRGAAARIAAPSMRRSMSMPVVSDGAGGSGGSTDALQSGSGSGSGADAGVSVDCAAAPGTSRDRDIDRDRDGDRDGGGRVQFVHPLTGARTAISPSRSMTPPHSKTQGIGAGAKWWLSPPSPSPSLSSPPSPTAHRGSYPEFQLELSAIGDTGGSLPSSVSIMKYVDRLNETRTDAAAAAAADAAAVAAVMPGDDDAELLSSVVTLGAGPPLLKSAKATHGVRAAMRSMAFSADTNAWDTKAQLPDWSFVDDVHPSAAGVLAANTTHSKRSTTPTMADYGFRTASTGHVGTLGAAPHPMASPPPLNRPDSATPAASLHPLRDDTLKDGHAVRLAAPASVSVSAPTSPARGPSAAPSGPSPLTMSIPVVATGRCFPPVSTTTTPSSSPEQKPRSAVPPLGPALTPDTSPLIVPLTATLGPAVDIVALPPAVVAAAAPSPHPPTTAATGADAAAAVSDISTIPGIVTIGNGRGVQEPVAQLTPMGSGAVWGAVRHLLLPSAQHGDDELLTTPGLAPAPMPAPAAAPAAAAAATAAAAAKPKPKKSRFAFHLGVQWTAGETLEDQYTVTKALGTGNFATVKLAEDKATRRKLAVKVIRKRNLFTEEERESVLREVEIHSTMHHPNIIQLVNVLETPDAVQLVMERAPGRDLQSLITRRASPQFSETVTRVLFEQLLEALEYIHHTRHVIHCDIKPENILFGKTLQTASDEDDDAPFLGLFDVVKVCDFGNARPSRDARYFRKTKDVSLVPCSSVMGTMGYIAPEVLQQKAYSTAVDMWSLGVLLFQMLGGYKPFTPYTKCLTTEVHFPDMRWSTISPEAKDLCRRMMQVNPAKRITAARARKHPWFQ